MANIKWISKRDKQARQAAIDATCPLARKKAALAAAKAAKSPSEALQHIIAALEVDLPNTPTL